MGTTTTTALALAALVLTACATGPTQQDRASAKAASDQALKAFLDCAARYAEAMDDKVSDASTIALALTSRCGREYDESTRTFGIAELDNDAQRRMFANRRNTVQARIEASLPMVIMNRNGTLRR